MAKSDWTPEDEFRIVKHGPKSYTVTKDGTIINDEGEIVTKPKAKVRQILQKAKHPWHDKVENLTIEVGTSDEATPYWDIIKDLPSAAIEILSTIFRGVFPKTVRTGTPEYGVYIPQEGHNRGVFTFAENPSGVAVWRYVDPNTGEETRLSPEQAHLLQRAWEIGRLRPVDKNSELFYQTLANDKNAKGLDIYSRMIYLITHYYLWRDVAYLIEFIPNFLINFAGLSVETLSFILGNGLDEFKWERRVRIEVTNKVAEKLIEEMAKSGQADLVQVAAVLSALITIVLPIRLPPFRIRKGKDTDNLVFDGRVPKEGQDHVRAQGYKVTDDDSGTIISLTIPKVGSLSFKSGVFRLKNRRGRFIKTPKVLKIIGNTWKEVRRIIRSEVSIQVINTKHWNSKVRITNRTGIALHIYYIPGTKRKTFVFKKRERDGSIRNYGIGTLQFHRETFALKARLTISFTGKVGFILDELRFRLVVRIVEGVSRIAKRVAGFSIKKRILAPIARGLKRVGGFLIKNRVTRAIVVGVKRVGGFLIKNRVTRAIAAAALAAARRVKGFILKNRLTRAIVATVRFIRGFSLTKRILSPIARGIKRISRFIIKNRVTRAIGRFTLRLAVGTFRLTKRLVSAVGRITLRLAVGTFRLTKRIAPIVGRLTLRLVAGTFDLVKRIAVGAGWLALSHLKFWVVGGFKLTKRILSPAVIGIARRIDGFILKPKRFSRTFQRDYRKLKKDTFKLLKRKRRETIRAYKLMKKETFKLLKRKRRERIRAYKQMKKDTFKFLKRKRREAIRTYKKLKKEAFRRLKKLRRESIWKYKRIKKGTFKYLKRKRRETIRAYKRFKRYIKSTKFVRLVRRKYRLYKRRLIRNLHFRNVPRLIIGTVRLVLKLGKFALKNRITKLVAGIAMRIFPRAFKLVVRVVKVVTWVITLPTRAFRFVVRHAIRAAKRYFAIRIPKFSLRRRLRKFSLWVRLRRIHANKFDLIRRKRFVKRIRRLIKAHKFTLVARRVLDISRRRPEPPTKPVKPRVFDYEPTQLLDPSKPARGFKPVTGDVLGVGSNVYQVNQNRRGPRRRGIFKNRR